MAKHVSQLLNSTESFSFIAILAEAAHRSLWIGCRNRWVRIFLRIRTKLIFFEVFADGPLVLEAGKFIQVGGITPDGTPSLAWYRSNDDNTKYNGIDKGIQSVKEHLLKGKFDVSSEL